MHGREVGLERQFIPTALAKRLPRDQLGTAPILRLVEEAHGQTAQQMKVNIRCGTPTAEEARYLRLGRSAPILIREHVFLTRGGKPFLCGRNIFSRWYQSHLELEEVGGQVVARQRRQTVERPERM